MLRAEGRHKELEISKISSDFGEFSHRQNSKSNRNDISNKNKNNPFSPIREEDGEDELNFEKKAT